MDFQGSGCHLVGVDAHIDPSYMQPGFTNGSMCSIDPYETT